MNGWQALDDFLRTDPRDVGCDRAMDLLHVYVDLVGIAAHLSACGPCSEDFQGLLAAVTRIASQEPG
jgi:hypothetical protein